MRVLWITGAPGVGKSAIGFQLFTEFARAGRPVAYVDIDQLGICYPPQADDPDRERLKADALRALLPDFHRAGAEILVVSGVLDPDLALEHPLFAIGGVSSCRLFLPEAALETRLLARGLDAGERRRIHDEAAELERRDVGARVDAFGASIVEVAARVRVVLEETADLDERLLVAVPLRRQPAEGTPGPSRVIVVSGTTCVGTSAVAWAVYQRQRAAGQRAAFLDLDQLSFVSPLPGDERSRIQRAHARSVSEVFAAASAEVLVVAAHLATINEEQLFARSFEPADVAIHRIRVSPEALLERVSARAGGEGTDLPGNTLRGLTERGRAELVGSALLAQEHRDAEADDALDVSGLTPDEAADQLLHGPDARPATSTAAKAVSPSP